MATKVVYFTVYGQDEQAEFRADDEPEDVKDLFRSAAEAGPNDILKLYNPANSLICLSPKVTANTPDTRYRLEVVAVQHSGSAAAEVGFDIGAIESRIESLERTILLEGGDMPQAVQEIKSKLEMFTQKLEHVDHLSWLGLYKDISIGTSLHPFWNKQNTKKTPEHCQRVYETFLKISQVQVTDKVREYLKKPTFDNWQWDEPEMMVLLRQMYIDLGFLNKFRIEMNTLHRWLYEIYRHYNQVPFHNFKHCFMVAQMMYGMTWLIDLRGKIDDLDLLILLTSAICHDLDHPGYNNAYQINAKTKLALRYNDISPLENHHCAVAFQILEIPGCNILENLSAEQYKTARESIIKCILATDMAKHNQILHDFKTLCPSFDFSNKEHKDTLIRVLIKVADISNEARPMEVSEPWVNCLLQEFFNQSDLEKLEGLPVAPFMDRDKVSKSSSQIGFIKFVLLPLFECLGQLFPVITDDVIIPVRRALEYYQDMQKALDEKQMNSDSLKNGLNNGISAKVK